MVGDNAGALFAAIRHRRSMGLSRLRPDVVGPCLIERMGHRLADEHRRPLPEKVQSGVHRKPAPLPPA